MQSVEDMRYARSIQSMMAPTTEQLNALFPKCMVYDRPMDRLSGDFLFVAERGPMSYLAACDCTGHGMSAALMTVLAREKLWQAINKASGPAHLLTRLDEKFRAAMMNGDTHAMRAIGMGLDLGSSPLTCSICSFVLQGPNGRFGLSAKASSSNSREHRDPLAVPIGGNTPSWKPRCRCGQETRSSCFPTACPTSLAGPKTAN